MRTAALTILCGAVLLVIYLFWLIADSGKGDNQ